MLKQFLVGAAIAATAASLSAVTVIKNSDVTLNIDGTMQGLINIEKTADLNADTKFYTNGVLVPGTNVTVYDNTSNAINAFGKDLNRITMFMKQARLDFNGNVRSTDFRLKLAFGGEEIPSSSTSVNSILSLLDAYGNTHIIDDVLQFRYGQMLVPYGRERLVFDEDTINADRSLNTMGFDMGRDIGLAFHGKIGLFSGAAGVFTGGGGDVPQRYLPEILGIPMMAVRLGVNNGLDKDAFTPGRGDTNGTEIKYAAYLNATGCIGNSRIGHGSALATRYVTKASGTGLLLNANWNPLGTTVTSATSTIFYQVGADAAVTVPITKDIEARASVEANFGELRNSDVKMQLWGGVADAIVTMKTLPIPLVKNVGVGMRYSLLNTPNNAKVGTSTTAASTVNTNTWTVVTGATTTSYTPIPQTLMMEFAPMVTAQIFDVKFIFELDIQRNALVVWEKGNGSYNLILMPNQTTTRNFMIENPMVFRGLMQFTF
ncbi:MAG: hypothetical protein HZC28_18295 [Spirochaetes bacterium]|nr:hypothetical protein [Spirochaetota bacterium]